jgi:hypothetical protein
MTDYLQLNAHSVLPRDCEYRGSERAGLLHAEEPHPDSLFADARQNAVPGPASDSLRLQVLGIISDVLEDGDPACAGARSHLRHCLAHNIGSPEKALLEHLLSLHGSDMHGSEMHGSGQDGAPGEPQDQHTQY